MSAEKDAEIAAVAAKRAAALQAAMTENLPTDSDILKMPLVVDAERQPAMDQPNREAMVRLVAEAIKIEFRVGGAFGESRKNKYERLARAAIAAMELKPKIQK